ncbi:hypothetical protein EAS56_12010 [Bradyrhizobium guangzhouense]|uniref:Uncharacterized protein n=1 Tax=Bradyrhizobium guangzhouense TaxID=1325095 RepID=A0AAE6C9V2_9BRAD|nr:hypothetical protein XH91_23460 [Bradyrhizobium guangzhouense]RXH14567.1 hypothetical protein EAS56_12010 [Bradyrhizobium guangzhouense]
MTKHSTARRKRQPRRQLSWLPLPLAGEGRGEGVSTRETPQEDRTLTRRARDDASHRLGRADLSRKRERCREPVA